MAEQNYFLEIESDPNNLITVEEFVNYFARDIGVKEEKMDGLILAVTEATTNAIKHGNKNNINKTVTINAKIEGDNLVIRIKDQGEGFDPSKIPDPTQPENLLKDSGRGVYLMGIYMDDLKYNVTSAGTETVLVLKLK